MDIFLQRDFAIRSGQAGFTILELLVVMGIIASLFGLATINLVRAQHNASVSATVDQLVSDLRVQQTKAMMGTKDTTGSANSYGIHVTGNSYSLFQGTSDPADGSDFTVTPTGVTFTTNLPNSILVFGHMSGEFSNYVTGPYSITVKNVNGTEQKTLYINRYGVVTTIQ